MLEEFVKLSPILAELEGALLFFCPGCKGYHAVEIKEPNQWGAIWTWDGNVEAPTISPSVNVVGRCHFFVRAGRIEYLSDCRHELAGQTVPMEPV